jgi:hypothetical protein
MGASTVSDERNARIAGHLRRKLERRNTDNPRFLTLLAGLTDDQLVAAHDRYHKSEVAYLAALNVKPTGEPEVRHTVELLVTREMRERHERRKATQWWVKS